MATKRRRTARKTSSRTTTPAAPHTENGRKPVIVTFKPKEERADKSADKLEILASEVSHADNVKFYDVSSAAEFTIDLPAGCPPARRAS